MCCGIKTDTASHNREKYQLYLSYDYYKSVEYGHGTRYETAIQSQAYRDNDNEHYDYSGACEASYDVAGNTILKNNYVCTHGNLLPWNDCFDEIYAEIAEEYMDKLKSEMEKVYGGTAECESYGRSFECYTNGNRCESYINTNTLEVDSDGVYCYEGNGRCEFTSSGNYKCY